VSVTLNENHSEREVLASVIVVRWLDLFGFVY